MRYGYYVRDMNESDLSSFFDKHIPIEVHLKASSHYGDVYLVKKHKGLTSSRFAQIDEDFKMTESYSGNDFGIYYAARRHFLWLGEKEIILSNSGAKHLLEKWED